MKRLLSLVGLCSALLLGACSPSATAPADQPSNAEAEKHRPADAQLAAIYERACINCHARRESQSPMTGHSSAWAPRLAKGQDALLKSVKQGMGSMPPMGLCPDCSDTDLRALIQFMSGPPA